MPTVSPSSRKHLGLVAEEADDLAGGEGPDARLLRDRHHRRRGLAADAGELTSHPPPPRACGCRPITTRTESLPRLSRELSTMSPTLSQSLPFAIRLLPQRFRLGDSDDAQGLALLTRPSASPSAARIAIKDASVLATDRRLYSHRRGEG